MKAAEFFKKVGSVLLGGVKDIGLNLAAEIISEPIETWIKNINERSDQYDAAAKALNELKGKYGEDLLQRLSDDICELERVKKEKRKAPKEKKAYVNFILGSMNCINEETIKEFPSLKNATLSDQQRAIEALLEFKNLLLSSLLESMDAEDQAFVQVVAQRVANETGETVTKALKNELNEAFFGSVRGALAECPNCGAFGNDLVPDGEETRCMHCGYHGSNEKFGSFVKAFREKLSDGLQAIQKELANVKVEIIATIQKAQGETNKQFAEAKGKLEEAQQQAENHFQEMGERLAELKEYGETDSESLEELKQVMEEQKNSLGRNFQQLSDDLQAGLSKLTNDMRADHSEQTTTINEHTTREHEKTREEAHKDKQEILGKIDEIKETNKPKAEGKEPCPCCEREVVLEPRRNNTEWYCPDCGYKVDPGLEPRANSCTDILDTSLSYYEPDRAYWLLPRSDKPVPKSPKAVRLEIDQTTMGLLNDNTITIYVDEEVTILGVRPFVLVAKKGTEVALPVTTLQRLIGEFSSKPTKICIGNGITLTGGVTSALKGYTYKKDKHCFAWEVSE